MACHQTGDNDKHEQKKKNIIKYNHDETVGVIQHSPGRFSDKGFGACIPTTPRHIPHAPVMDLGIMRWSFIKQI